MCFRALHLARLPLLCKWAKTPDASQSFSLRDLGEKVGFALLVGFHQVITYSRILLAGSCFL